MIYGGVLENYDMWGGCGVELRMRLIIIGVLGFWVIIFFRGEVGVIICNFWFVGFLIKVDISNVCMVVMNLLF